MEPNPYERLGRLLIAYETECDAHRKSIELIRQIKSGEIDIGRVQMAPNGWTLNPEPLSVTVE